MDSRPDDLQSGFLRVKLPRLSDWNGRRRHVAERHRAEIAWHEGRMPPAPDVEGSIRSSWHLFAVRSTERDELQRSLDDYGVQTLIHYPIPPHRQRAYRDLRLATELPIAEALGGEVLSLPIGPHLSDEPVGAVVAGVHQFCSANAVAPVPRPGRAARCR